MFISVFRSDKLINVLLLAFIVVILRLPILLDFVDMTKFQSIEIANDFSIGQKMNVIFAMIIVFIQSIVFSSIINKHNFFQKATFMPALMYIIVSSFLVPFLTLSTALICNFIILLILDLLLGLHDTERVLSSMFDMGLLISFGSFLYPPFIYLLPVIWISLFIFQPFSIREWFSGVIGVISPLIIMGTYLYWNDNYKDIIQSLDSFYIIALPFQDIDKLESSDYLASIPLLIIILLSLKSATDVFFKNVILVRRSLECLGILVMLIVLSYVAFANAKASHLMLLAAPLGTFMTLYFNTANKPWVYEGFFIMLIGSIYYFQLN